MTETPPEAPGNRVTTNEYLDRKYGPTETVLEGDADRDTWLAERQNSIGASEVGAVLGSDPYKTAFHVFREKSPGWSGPAFHGNTATEWGHRLEPAVLGKTEDELRKTHPTGADVRVVSDGRLLRRPGTGHLHATPDGLTLLDGRPVSVVEAKTTIDDTHWRDGKPPPQYWAQLQTQMGILGFTTGYLAAIHLPTRTFHLQIHPLDKKWFDHMVQITKKFWSENVQTGNPPMHDMGHPKTRSLLAELHPDVTNTKPLEIDDNLLNVLSQYQETREIIARTEKISEKLRNQILHTMGGHRTATYGGKTVAQLPAVHTERLDTTTLKRHHPDLYRAYTIESRHRRLTTVEQKEEK